MLTAYAQASPARELCIWVGAFDAGGAPPPLRFRVNEAAIAPVSGGLTPIRDGQLDAGGRPRNFRGVFVLRPPAAAVYRVEVEGGSAPPFRFTTSLLPQELPTRLDGRRFNILLCSCYYRPRDGGKLAGTLATLKARPDLMLMAGDQVYGDLPLAFGRPRSPAAIRAELGMKYQQNWASRAHGGPGLADVLAQAPAVCVPDDHEFWNNYPFRQAQLTDSYVGGSRAAWIQAARELYEDYQLSDAARTGTTRLDVGPLKMLFVDMRCDRDEDYRRLMKPAAWTEYDRWVGDLIATPDAVGLLSSGQALFMKKPGPLAKHAQDAEMPNYAEFERLCAGLARLADARVPVLYVTGDVHWGRMAEGIDLPSGQSLLYEVIASPSVLIDSPLDRITSALHRHADATTRWPRHSPADPVPERFGPHNRFQLHATQPSVLGDQIAVLSFTRNGGAVECDVTYHSIPTDAAPTAPQPQPTIKLTRF